MCRSLFPDPVTMIYWLPSPGDPQRFVGVKAWPKERPLGWGFTDKYVIDVRLCNERVGSIVSDGPSSPSPFTWTIVDHQSPLTRWHDWPPICLRADNHLLPPNPEACTVFENSMLEGGSLKKKTAFSPNPYLLFIFFDGSFFPRNISNLTGRKLSII